MANLAIHLTLFPLKIFHLSEKLARHRSAEKKGHVIETNRPIIKKQKKKGCICDRKKWKKVQIFVQSWVSVKITQNYLELDEKM